jgi:16S rRNA (cytosine1402-N4)-methyltransferase
MNPKRHPRRSTPAGGHLPVLLEQVLAVLAPQPGETAADVTLGMAGHATAILQRLGPGGLLLGCDLDADNLSGAEERLSATGCPFRLFHLNFAALPTIIGQQGLSGVDMIIADLGMSSMQVDDPQRGFSYVRDGPLDMRMDRSRGQSAGELLATISEADLAEALRELGDEPFADRIARALVKASKAAPLQCTTEVSRVIGEALKVPISRDQGWRLHPDKSTWKTHPAARTFQVLRILVNRELANLQHLLRVLPTCLNPGGRAAIISFHSGEDRLVKASFRAGLDAGLYAEIADDPLRAKETEKVSNPRSRSAKLRWARKA